MKILLFGGQGQLGWELQRALAPLGTVIAPRRAEADLADEAALRACVRRHAAPLIVNAAADTAVDRAETQPGLAHAINARAVAILADEAFRSGARLVHYSTDYVFDGRKADAYTEDDATCPLNVYGQSKLAGEEEIRQRALPHLILRVSWLYSPRRSNFARTMLRLACAQEAVDVVADQFGAPTSAELVADCTAHALRRWLAERDAASLAGTYHLCASGRTSWHGYARALIALARERGHPVRVRDERIVAVDTAQFAAAARRPANSQLDTTRFRSAFGLALPDWQSGLARFVEEAGSERENR